jgi:hypothetical protein
MIRKEGVSHIGGRRPFSFGTGGPELFKRRRKHSVLETELGRLLERAQGRTRAQRNNQAKPSTVMFAVGRRSDLALGMAMRTRSPIWQAPKTTAPNTDDDLLQQFYSGKKSTCAPFTITRLRHSPHGTSPRPLRRRSAMGGNRTLISERFCSFSAKHEKHNRLAGQLSNSVHLGWGRDTLRLWAS